MNEEEEKKTTSEETKSLIREKSIKEAKASSKKVRSSSKDVVATEKKTGKRIEKERRRKKRPEKPDEGRKAPPKNEKHGHLPEEEKPRSKERSEKGRGEKQRRKQKDDQIRTSSKERQNQTNEKQKAKSNEKQSQPADGKRTERKSRRDEPQKGKSKERQSRSRDNSKSRSKTKEKKEKEKRSKINKDGENDTKNKSRDSKKIPPPHKSENINNGDEKISGLKNMISANKSDTTHTTTDTKLEDENKKSQDSTEIKKLSKQEKRPSLFDINSERHILLADQAIKTDIRKSANLERKIVDNENGLTGSAPYKHSVINHTLRDAQNPSHPGKYSDVLSKLTEYGVTVYEIGYEATVDGGNLLGEIKDVAEEVSNRVRTSRGLQERCLLYIDRYGRPFNISIVGGSVGLIGSWKSSLSTFSGLEATMAIAVLSRSFACTGSDFDLGVRPGYLGLLLGLVLSEEIALAHLHVIMLVWGAPSVSSYELLMHFSSDWPRKLVIFVLAVASAAPEQNNIQKSLTLLGVGLAICVLAANLGSRAWFNLKLRPLRYSGQGYQILATLFAICTGLTAPYVGFREVIPGGEIAFVSILKNSFIVGVVFVLSDIDVVQKFIINGSEECSQDSVNIIMGLWWSLSLLSSLFLCGRIKKYVINPEDCTESNDQPLLIKAHDSPVGFKVRHIPDFAIDETLRVQSKNIFSVLFLRLLGLFMAVFGGIGILFLSFTDIDEKIMGS